MLFLNTILPKIVFPVLISMLLVLRHPICFFKMFDCYETIIDGPNDIEPN